MFFFWKKKEKVDFEVDDPHPEASHCFISGNVLVHGEVYFAGTLRVDGRIDGRVSVYDGKRGTLIVSKGAIINGPVNVTELITDGLNNGEVIVENRLECRSNAVLKGQVSYKTISISDGARIEGKCQQQRVQLREVGVKANKSAAGGTFEGKAKGLSLATRDVQYLRKP